MKDIISGWEGFLAYRNAWKWKKSSRDNILNLFISRQYPDLFYDDIRKKEWQKESRKRAYTRFKITPSYKKNQKKAKIRARMERRDLRHKDLNWILTNWKARPRFINSKTGYVQITLLSKTYQVHRLVWMEANNSFIPKNLEVNHIDLNKTNNHISNLEIVTQEQNMQHFFNSDKNTKRKEKTKQRYLEIHDYYHAQPVGFKIKNTIIKFNIKRNYLCWIINSQLI